MIAHNREDGGKLVRAAWVSWAMKQPDPKPSWLVPWEGLSEQDKEADRCIWDAIASPYEQRLTTVLTTLRTSDNLQQSVVRGAIIGALAGGHIDGRDGASYSKNVLRQIADLLGIELPEIVG